MTVSLLASPGSARGGDEGRDVSSRSAWLDRIVAACLVVVTVALGWSRLTPLVRRTAWAEDAGLFLVQRLDRGPFATLLLPYDGYLHLVPRIVVDLVVAVSTDEDQFALGTTVASLVVVGLAAALVFLFSASFVTSRVMRAALALVPVLAPMAALEALGNAANLHWFLLYLLPFAVVWRPRRTTGHVVQVIVIVVVVLSEVQSVIFLPLVLLVLVRRVTRSGAVALVLACVAQLASVVASPRVRGDAPLPEVVNVAIGFVAEPVMGSWVSPGRAADLLTGPHGVAVALAATAPFVIALGAGLVRRRSSRNLLIAVLGYGVLAVWVTDVYANPTVTIDFVGHGLGLTRDMGYVRYALVPSMFLIALLALGIDRLAASRSLVSRGGAVLLVMVLVVALTRQFAPYSYTRISGPDWAASVATARVACEADPEGVVRVASAPAGWGVDVACSDLDGDGFDR
ncbi:hypothetical protein [Frigoribacterium sp. RIT-PI-h]|uniref:hypothetical protein n=1 Tax=Frigoribacterium sp. RIT-PI-h TaxID=1690245 RepID=UPI0006B8CC68|nr:hypothetical protein [Frigoribacterium sp. RIT-PI-h]KPG81331.1 hypothetical protein AEQ27_10540 [Frigoribacterium sp. RIT-PI-h]